MEDMPDRTRKAVGSRRRVKGMGRSASDCPFLFNCLFMHRTRAAVHTWHGTHTPRALRRIPVSRYGGIRRCICLKDGMAWQHALTNRTVWRIPASYQTDLCRSGYLEPSGRTLRSRRLACLT